MTLSKLKQEINQLSGWFKVVLIVTFVLYVSLWFFTIHLSNIQKAKGLEPLLPGASKDSQGYVLLSDSIIHGNGFSTDGRPETLRTPGYPVFAAIIRVLGGSYFAVTLVQIFLVFGSALVVRRIGILFSSRTVGEIAATLLLINPVTITLSLLILTDTLFLFLFVLGVYEALIVKEDGWAYKTFVASIFFIGAIYVRGMGIFAIPIFIAPLLASATARKVQIKSIILMAILLVMSVIPWIARNYIETGVASFNSFESVNLSFAVPKFLANLHGTDVNDESLIFQKETGVPSYAWQDGSYYDIRYSKQIDAVGEKILLEHPFSYLKYHIVSSLPFLFPSSILFMRDVYDSAIGYNRPFKPGSINALVSGDWRAFYNGVKEVWWKFAERICWLLALTIGVYSVWKDRKKILVWVFVFIIGYLMFLSGPAAGPRLSLQAWPFMFTLFAYGGLSLFQKFSRRGA